MQNFIYIIILKTFSLHESNIIYSVSNDGIEWSLEFAPDSMTLMWKIPSKNWQQVPEKIVWQLGSRCWLEDNSSWTII